MKKLVKRMMAVAMAASMIAGVGTTQVFAESKGELVFWNFFTGPDGENMAELIDGFNATNPEYTIKSVTMSAGDMYTKIPTVVNSGTDIPDFITLHTARVAMYQNQGLLESVEGLIEYQPELKKENYTENVWNVGDIDGEQYAIPLDMGVVCTVYNKELLEKYAPNALDDNVITLDELKEMIPLASADGIVTYPNYFSTQICMALLAQDGKTLFTEDNTPYLNSPEMIKAVNTRKEIVDLGGTNEEGDDTFQLFLAGECIFLPTGIWDKNAIDNGADFEYGLANTIAYSADKVTNFSYANQLALLKNDERSDEKEKVIADFFEYLRQNTLEWAYSGMVPASNSENDNEEYKAMKQYFFVSAPEIESTIFFDSSLYAGYAEDALNAVMNDMIYGNIEVEEGLNQAQKEVEDKIAQSN